VKFRELRLSQPATEEPNVTPCCTARNFSLFYGL